MQDDKDNLLLSLRRLHTAAWNKGDDDGGVFAKHRVSRDPLTSSAGVNMDAETMVTVLRWTTNRLGGQPFLGLYDVKGVLIRDEYTRILLDAIKIASVDDVELILNDTARAQVQNPFMQPLPEFYMRGISISGTPGIGKSTFLIYVLALRLLAGKPTVFQESLTKGYLLDEKGAMEVPEETFTDELQPAGTWFLIDSNPNLKSVPYGVTHAARQIDGFIIQSASPRDERFEWFEKVGKASPEKIYMAPWTVEELIAGCDLQLYDPHLTEKAIEAFCEKFGTSARAVYGSAFRPASYEKRVREKIAHLDFNIMKDLVRVPVRDIKTDHHFSHMYLFSVPRPGDRTQCITGIPTRYLTMLVHEHLRNVQQIATEEMYHYFVANAFTRASAGYLLERLFMERFPSGGIWPMKVMEKNPPGTVNVHWHYDDSSAIRNLLLGWQSQLLNISVGNAPSGSFQALHQINFEENEQLQLESAFYLPVSKSQVSFDAFAVSNTGDGLVATIFQVTVKRRHVIKQEGLIWLENLGARFIDLVVVTCPIKVGLGGCDDIEVPKGHADRLRHVYHLELA